MVIFFAWVFLAYCLLKLLGWNKELHSLEIAEISKLQFLKVWSSIKCLVHGPDHHVFLSGGSLWLEWYCCLSHPARWSGHKLMIISVQKRNISWLHEKDWLVMVLELISCSRLHPSFCDRYTVGNLGSQAARLCRGNVIE